MKNIFTKNRVAIEAMKNKIDKSASPIEEVLDLNNISNTFNENHEFRERLYTPIKTLIAFTRQSFSKQKKSCSQAVSEVVAEEASKGNWVSSDTGAFTKARARLSGDAMLSVMTEIDGVANDVPEQPPRWNGFHVKMIDGTTIQMADTKSNQDAYPQHANQEEGSGFPIARIVVIMSLFTGTIIDYSIGSYKGKLTGEHALFREIQHHICSQTLLLADAYYPSYFLISELLRRSAHGIFKASNIRDNEKHIIENIDKNDDVVCWTKPSKAPEWMEQDAYSKHPDSLKLRLIKVDGVLYITTLMDQKHHRKEISSLYKSRWHVELNLRSIKTFMGMSELNCKSPEMVKKEITAHFIGYNIIRLMMVQSAVFNGCSPSDIGFVGAMNQIESFTSFIQFSGVPYRLWLSMLDAIASTKVGNRPGRSEPRVVKRRPKSFPRMKGKRSEYKQKAA